MKKNIVLAGAVAFLGLATAPLFAQTSTTTTSTTGYIQSSTVIGSKIKDSKGQDVGEIKDIVLDRSSGCLAYVVLSTRGGGTTTATPARPQNRRGALERILRELRAPRLHDADRARKNL